MCLCSRVCFLGFLEREGPKMCIAKMLVLNVFVDGNSKIMYMLLYREYMLEILKNEND